VWKIPIMLSTIAEDVLQCHEGLGGNRVLDKLQGQHACIRGPSGESEAENRVRGIGAAYAGGPGFELPPQILCSTVYSATWI
jgi:hypothetical protein